MLDNLFANLTKSFPPITQGDFTVRLAQNAEEIILAQQLRFVVFCEEKGAKPSPEMLATRSDFDDFDEICDHLLVIYHPAEKPMEVVGTYRLLRGEKMPLIGRFYSESEFDVAKLKKSGLRLLELGRSCVREDMRSKVVMQLLWRGIGAYIAEHNIQMMFGCGSFTGVNLQEHAVELSYLYHYHLAPDAISPRAVASHYENMNILPKEAIDAKKAFLNMPVLIKGYLRLGGMVGDGAFVDCEYNTTDICILVQTEGVGDKYVARYGA